MQQNQNNIISENPFIILLLRSSSHHTIKVQYSSPPTASSICSWSSLSRLSPKQPFCFLSLSSSPFMHSPPLNTPWKPHLGHLLDKLSFTSR
nr:hypothetical protein Iba_chr08eCG6360 [Ipomoea batatas]